MNRWSEPYDDADRIEQRGCPDCGFIAACRCGEEQAPLFEVACTTASGTPVRVLVKANDPKQAQRIAGDMHPSFSVGDAKEAA